MNIYASLHRLIIQICVKVAIFHDYFSTIGGGERVVMAIANCLHADIYTTDCSMPEWFDPFKKIHSLGEVSEKPFLRQMGATKLFWQSDLSDKYDMFVFSGNWAHHASRNHNPSLYYCHTPIRALYDLYPVFQKRFPYPIRTGFSSWASVMRVLDRQSIKKIDGIVANSKNVQERIRQYYFREAPVIYPPVDTSLYSCRECENYWLSVNRLYPEKRIDLQIEAFSHMPDQNLIIVGGTSLGDHAVPYSQYIRRIADTHSNVTILGQISDSELLSLYSRCRGLICTAIDEDFGITPLEAMASGKPVIAVAEGGFVETVTPECGKLIQPDVKSIIEAVEKISRHPETYLEACKMRASEFDIKVFNTAIINAVTKTYETWSHSV